MTPELPEQDRTRLWIAGGFALVFTLMLTGSAIAMRTMSRVNANMASVVQDTNEKTAKAYQARDAIRLRSTTMQSLLQSEDPEQSARLIERIAEYTSSYQSSRAALEALNAEAQETDSLERIAKAEERTHASYQHAIEQYYNPVYLPDTLKARFGEVQLHELVLLNHLNELVKLENTLATERFAASEQDTASTQHMLLWVLLATFLFSLLISLVVIHRVAEAHRRIHHMARHDDLTGLHNRRAFEERLTQVIQNTEHGRVLYGLLYLDMDRFKVVNDTCGHHVGDLLLQEITQMIKARLRRHDLFARVGGDEFAIIAEVDNLDALTALAEDLRQRTHDYNFEYAGETFKVSFSIGAVPITGHETDLEKLMQDVDSACYVAKQAGRNRVHVAQQNDTEVVKYRNDIAGIQAINQALESDALQLFFQPVYAIQNHDARMAHCEILLRFIDEEGYFLSPANFIPIAEKYNLMADIDRWVVKHVIAWLEAHQDVLEIPRLLVNLSGGSVIDDEFLAFLLEQLESSSIDKGRIAFEITETAAVDNLDKAHSFMQSVKRLGCKFALDDFGTGFSTFEYLKKLPIDYLKIDGSLVRNLAHDRIDQAMVRAINQIGHATGASTIAEFVEDDTTLEVLRSIGVDYAQGWGLGRPEHMDELPALLNNVESPRRAG